MEIFQYTFIQNALISGVFIGLLTAILGVFLVLKKLSLIGDGLSHLSFGAISIGLFFGIYPLWVAIPVVILASLLIQFLIQKSFLDGDSSIGIISSLGISTGVIFSSIGKGFNIDLFSYLFGNILTITKSELTFSIILAIIILFVIYIYYYDLLYITFDIEQAKVSGVRVNFIQSILSILTAITIVLAIRMVGIMLVSALIIIPANTALQISKGFKQTLINSGIISVFSIFIGILMSFKFNLPSGATIIFVNLFLFVFSIIINKK